MLTGNLILTAVTTASCFFLLVPFCMGQSDEALNEYLEMAKVVETQQKATNELHTIDITDLGADEIHERKRRAAALTGCPTFTEAYKNKAARLKDRSISPWKFVTNYDSRRPFGKRYILDSVCLCEGCIDPISGVEVRSGLKSVGMDLPRAVRLYNATTNSYELSYITLHFGCHCVIQNNNNPQ